MTKLEADILEALNELDAAVKAEMAKMGKVIKDAGIREE